MKVQYNKVVKRDAPGPHAGNLYCTRTLCSIPIRCTHLAVSCQLSASLVAPAVPNTACSPGELVSKHVYYLDQLRDSASTWR